MKNILTPIVFSIILSVILCLCVPETRKDSPIPFKELEFVSVYDHEKGVVITMGVEEYVLKCLAKEMPATFEMEALKAQAVAIRSYLSCKKEQEKHDGAMVCTDFNCCAAFLRDLSSLNKENQERLRNAVLETKGQILMFDGYPANTVFHAISAGKTENAKDVWGTDLPYLRSVVSDVDKSIEKYESSATFTKENIKEIFSVNNAEISGIERTDAGYVKLLKIGGQIFSGAEIRKRLNLRSTAFDVTAVGEDIIFNVKGYGHGVGMSQWGANEYAKKGFSYKQILEHYYSGCSLT
ncbi:MAG: stage II sporulation protein D [Clostridia bacterium]|nr:stage II sporulation protein D [Clostridia bacterium]